MSDVQKKKISQSMKGKVDVSLNSLIREINTLIKNGFSSEKLCLIVRRLREMNAEGTHSAEDWRALKAKHLHMCSYCKKSEPEVTLTKDHIIPLSLGGSNDICNIQPLCLRCNSKKGNKKIYD